MALDGVSWVRGGLVETALAARGLAVRQNRRRPLLPPSGHPLRQKSSRFLSRGALVEASQSRGLVSRQPEGVLTEALLGEAQ
jgi:hypothetical protein